MTKPLLKGGKSLSQRIRSYAPGVSNGIIAAELGANPRTVAVVRAKQKRPTAYLAQARDAQRLSRRKERSERSIAWALAWAETFSDQGPCR